MKNDPRIELNANKLVQYLEKMSEEFTKDDIIKYIEDNNIRRVNFRYVGGDGRLKTLNFIVTSKQYLDRLLSLGERVDGSSLFPNISVTESDLYVIPRFRTAFLNPFTTAPTVDILCSYYGPDGLPFKCSPENILYSAHKSFQKDTGCSIYAMGELEYYVISSKHTLYLMKSQKGYKESQPFSKMENLRFDAMEALAQVGCSIKYGHNEVGNVQEEDRYLEQNEIEFLPVPIEDAADQLVLGRWVLRMVGQKYGATVTFAPKIAVDHAGTGLHIHFIVKKNGTNVLFSDGKLTDTARRTIAGILKMTPSLTAFGNIVPTSYLRLVPNQEAPTGVFWGERNRIAIVRVPLGWQDVKDMVVHANPNEKKSAIDVSQSGTIEFRCPDGSADVYHLLAGLAIAIREGVQMPNGIQLSERLYISPGTRPVQYGHSVKDLPHIPRSCWESADYLLKDRAVYERDDVFPATVIDSIVKKLKAFEDRELKLYNKTTTEIKHMLDEYLHCA